MQFSRYGVYFTPRAGTFAAAGAAWLGWDIAQGRACTAAGGDLTDRPRKYGFHATLKAPFRLADGVCAAELAQSTSDLAANLHAVALSGIQIARMGSFLALTPSGDATALKALAAEVVTGLDALRAPLTEAERARKTRPNMGDDLRENLERYGYPHVLGQFNFHMTLTGPLAKTQIETALTRATAHFSTKIPEPLLLDSLTLVGETDTEFFVEIERFSLGPVAD